MNNENSNCFERVGSAPQSELYRVLGKRVFDVVLTLLVLPLVIPITGILALLIALDGGKPFYRQDQIGKNGHIYRVWKLRLMVKDADVWLEHHRHHECGNGPDSLDASRLTGFGQFLRKSSFDELPQFFNVLAGDMSLVGPRPMVTSPTALYPGGDYYDLQPGITGLCQISDQPYLTLSQRAVCDARYNRTLSFANDLAILAGAFKAVLRRT
ncbi:sugar transferase [Roseovarius sp. Pro17]|uniref:sugar transferase n=1 Tax=Roseovarius sp. Pro17 TaxID=3108175 RepID=UPI002D79429A|nr:sugar transferase [Roseovarius sp. Pro17]